MIELIKRHYEKIILSVVLVALAVVAGLLTLKVKQVQDDLERARGQIQIRKATPLAPPSVAGFEEAEARILSQTPFTLCQDHNLFNPVRWERTQSGQLVKVQTGNEIGPGALMISRITPLKLIISYDGVQGTGADLRYVVGVTQQAAADPNLRRDIPQYVNVGDQRDLFSVVGVRGPVDTPTALVLKLSDTGERITITRTQPYSRTTAYAADLSYPPERRTFADLRVTSMPIQLEGQPYKVLVVRENEVVLSDLRSSQRFDIMKKAAAP